MRLFLVLILKEGDDAYRITEALVDTLTQAAYLEPGEVLSFSRTQDTLLVYRSFPLQRF